jgi:hypothetical protein
MRSTVQHERAERRTGQLDQVQLVPEPARHRASLEANAHSVRSALTHNLGYSARLSAQLAFNGDLSTVRAATVSAMERTSKCAGSASP